MFKYTKVNATQGLVERFNIWEYVQTQPKHPIYMKDMPPPEGKYTEVVQIYPLAECSAWTRAKIILAISHSDIRPVY